MKRKIFFLFFFKLILVSKSLIADRYPEGDIFSPLFTASLRILSDLSRVRKQNLAADVIATKPGRGARALCLKELNVTKEGLNPLSPFFLLWSSLAACGKHC